MPQDSARSRPRPLKNNGCKQLAFNI